MSPAVAGHLFDGETLAATPVVLSLDRGVLRMAGATISAEVPLSEVRVSARLADVPRYLYLPDNRTVETHDNAFVDAWLASERRGRVISVVHALERHSRLVAVATLLLVVATLAALRWGLPALARTAAMAVPVTVEQQAGRTGHAAINRLLARSSLKPGERQRVQAQLDRLVEMARIRQRPQLVFCSMAGQNPNAFALPGGIIIISDELIALTAGRDEEIAAVLAHEIAHWQRRHGLQSVLRSSTALLVVTALTGDLSALTSFAGTLPLFLLRTGYSREFETEADAYAHDLLAKASLSPSHLADILEKLEKARPKTGPDLTYLSTHPSTKERVQALRVQPVSPAHNSHPPTPASPAVEAPESR